MASAQIGVFGGSGFYSFLDDVTHVQVQTPYGSPSSAIALGTANGVDVAFLPRHGPEHQVPAHMVNYRANMWAMRELGVDRVIGPCAAGSLKPELEPGHVVMLDQLVDRTSARKDTYFDGPLPGHVSIADPYCPDMRKGLVAAAHSIEIPVHESGTVVVVQGPRFSTRAESNWYRGAGWDVVNMTQYPEVALARELGICYAGMAFVTDYDTGLEGEPGIEPVSMEQVFAVLHDNAGAARRLLFEALPLVATERNCDCAEALEQGPLRRS